MEQNRANTAGLGFSQKRGNTGRNKTGEMRIGRKRGPYVGGEARYLCIQESGHLYNPGNRLPSRWGDSTCIDGYRQGTRALV